MKSNVNVINSNCIFWSNSFPTFPFTHLWTTTAWDFPRISCVSPVTAWVSSRGIPQIAIDRVYKAFPNASFIYFKYPHYSKYRLVHSRFCVMCIVLVVFCLWPASKIGCSCDLSISQWDKQGSSIYEPYITLYNLYVRIFINGGTPT